MLNNPANKLCTDLQKERKIAKGRRKREELWQLPTSLESSLWSDQGTAIRHRSQATNVIWQRGERRGRRFLPEPPTSEPCSRSTRSSSSFGDGRSEGRGQT